MLIKNITIVLSMDPDDVKVAWNGPGTDISDAAVVYIAPQLADLAKGLDPEDSDLTSLSMVTKKLIEAYRDSTGLSPFEQLHIGTWYTVVDDSESIQFQPDPELLNELAKPQLTLVKGEQDGQRQQ